jgi:hypothetical protein
MLHPKEGKSMRNTSFPIVLLGVSIAACGSPETASSHVPMATMSSHRAKASSPAAPMEMPSEATVFTAPELLDGYTRLQAQTIADIQPGTDATFCQYVMAPADRDMDIVDVRGAQSKFGHHAVAFSYTGTGSEELGKSVPCSGTEFTAGAAGGSSAAASGGGLMGMGGYLGSVGGDSLAPSMKLPEGVAFRLKKGDGVLLNLHYINTGEEPIDGDAVLDLKFEEADPDRMIAALFVAINARFMLTPSVQTDSSIDCAVKSDVDIIMMANHMHEYGISASTQVLRADTGAMELLREDAAWTYDMQFNPTYTRWEVTSPFTLHAGDAIRTSCSWMNSSDASISFPREMCISAGFALAHGDNPKAPGACFNGAWIAGGF